ncbi:hypothetical protein [Ureibacillus endophyticus]|uniref:DUF3954 domain-containing protein n=1 Tax=Ureibacillus endophyticus TaxID=1978490 RepID=A0A494YRT8_9BACL|nr:hypothetical protein [Lysinibacillus endophyticus]RKQ12279.1 hypothetical protein D8M03_17165 [Lysinibacillus endophyticus]
MKPLKIDANGALYISAEELKQPCVVVVSEKKVMLQPLNPFGTLEVITQNNKVLRINNNESILF